jgi:transcriptional regulator with XRE-family HTH domain
LKLMPPQPGAKKNNYHPTDASAHQSGLALIENIYFRSGVVTAQEQLKHLLGPNQFLRPYSISEQNEPHGDVGSASIAEVTWTNYNPPASWNAPYSILLVNFSRKGEHSDEYGFFLGEEIFVPIRGEMEFRFFWTPGGRPPERTLLVHSATERSIIRVNPQIPHYIRAREGKATAWLILRHATNSPVGIVMDQALDSLTTGQSLASPSLIADREPWSISGTVNRRTITEAELRKPGVYGLVAWGIAELIREAHQNTGRSTSDLAKQIGIDPSSLSRLEEAKTNVSIEMLAKVCRSLRTGMAECIDSGSWNYEAETMKAQRTMQAEAALWKPRGTHALHPHILLLARGEGTTVEVGYGHDTSQISSWIVVKGRVLLDFPQTWGGKTGIIDTGSVIHFREHGTLGVHALVDSTIVEMVHSQSCGCKSRSAAETG